MFTRRMLAALLAAIAAIGLGVAPAAAAKPAPPAPPPAESVEDPLTPEQEAASERKIAAAEAYARSTESSGGSLVGLDCVTPTSGGMTPDACYVPQGFLGVEARDQTRWFYCGPAVGQVIANYSWAVGAGLNKYTQAVIAGWMATDINLQTNASWLVKGLERATASSPRRPAGWAWVVTELRDRDGDRTTGDELQAYVKSNISGSRMPLAISVKPHHPDSAFNLSSWPKPVVSGGHWIAVYGWYGNWTGTDSARIYYTDSSRDEGGSTGKFWNSTRSIAALIGEHTQRFVW